MNLRDLKPKTLKRLAMEGENEYDEWFKRTGGLQFGSNESLTFRDIWRTAYSRGMSNCLKRIDHGNFKEEV